MRLDTDLGIDSIKRVEIFSAIQERLPGMPAGGAGTDRRPGHSPRDRRLPERRAADAGPHIDAGPGDMQPPADHGRESLAQVLLEAVAEKTGYPIEMLELDMRLDADLGIDSIKRVEILSAVQDRLPQVASISPEQLGALGTLRAIIEALSATPAPPAISTHAHQNGRAAATKNANGKHHQGGNLNGNTNPEHHGSSSDGTLAPSLSMRYPSVRSSEDGAGGNVVRLRAGGTVWVTADGSPLTDAICTALAERDFRCQVIRLDDGSTPEPDERLFGLIIVAPQRNRTTHSSRPPSKILRAAGPALERSATRGGAAFLTVTRLEGTFGLAGLSAAASPGSGRSRGNGQDCWS